MAFRGTLDNIFKPKPLSLFGTSVLIIFLAEAVVMLFVPMLDIASPVVIGLIDATLLSLIVTPVLYGLFFRPMRNTIMELDKSEIVQQRLLELDELKSEFISIASHELCSPVSTIAAFVELLLAGVSPQQQKKYLHYILDRTDALERIIGDLEVVKALETGEGLSIRKETVDLSATVSDVVKGYQKSQPDRPFQLDVPSHPVMMQLDEVRMIQVLDNVISNAMKYSNDVHDPIDVTLEDYEQRVEIIVRDEGLGMTPEDVDMIFTKFFRAQTEKSAVGGLGLGMAIVKDIVDGHGGDIDIISQRKVGTTVTIALPK